MLQVTKCLPYIPVRVAKPLVHFAAQPSSDNDGDAEESSIDTLMSLIGFGKEQPYPEAPLSDDEVDTFRQLLTQITDHHALNFVLQVLHAGLSQDPNPTAGAQARGAIVQAFLDNDPKTLTMLALQIDSDQVPDVRVVRESIRQIESEWDKIEPPNFTAQVFSVIIAELLDRWEARQQ